MSNLKPKPHHKSIKLLVPDTVFFHNGVTKFLVHNKKDREYNYIKARHKLTNNELKDFFQERKRKNELDIQMYYPELLLAKRKREMDEQIKDSSIKRVSVSMLSRIKKKAKG